MMNSSDDDYKNKLSDFAKLIQEGKKHKLEENKRRVEEKKKELAKKLHKEDFSIDSSNFLDNLFGAISSKEITPLVVENPDYVPIPEIPEEIKPVTENVEQPIDVVKPEIIQEVEVPSIPEPEENLITKTVKTITKVAENTNLMSTTPVDKVDPNFKAVQDKLKYLEQWVSKISNAGPGSGSYWLNDLGDTDKQSLYNATDKQVLTYDFASRKWTAQDPQGGGSGGTTDDYARYNSNSAYSQANTATTLAQSAFDYANTIVSDTQVDPFARTQANTATTLAQSAFDYANTIVSDTQLDPWARTQANSAYNKANTVETLAQSAFNYANTIISDTQIDPYARNTANSASANTIAIQGGLNTANANIAYILGSDLTQNTNITLVGSFANGAFTLANSTNTKAQAAFDKANTSITTSGGTITNSLNVTYTPASTTGYALTIAAANTVGGTGYADVLKFLNNSGGATNISKTIRISQSGALEIINSAYSGRLIELTDAGNLDVSGNVTSSGVKSGYSSGRPGFRVYGSGTTNNLGTTTNTTGALNSNNFAVDFNQGSYLNTTTGVFTAPVAGLYQVNLITRNAGNAAYSQLAIVKNATGGNGAGGSVAIMIEFAGNSTMNHTGGSTVLQMAVGDTIACKVLAGTINFDQNDNWSVAYLG